MEVLSAERSADLEAIQDRLHDVDLELPDELPTTGPTTVRMAGLDDRSTLLPIRSWGPFANFERRRARVALVVEHVTAAELVDHAQIGSLNLAKVWFDEAASTLHIEGHIPVELRLRVERLDLRAEVTDERWPRVGRGVYAPRGDRDRDCLRRRPGCRCGAAGDDRGVRDPRSGA